jgi:hypothetical protein
MLINKENKYNCPKCGDSNTLMNYLGDMDKEKGTVPKESNMSMSTQTIYTNIKRKIGDKVMVASIHNDMCMTCGQPFVSMISFNETTVQASTQQPKLITLPGGMPLPKDPRDLFGLNRGN